MNTIDPNLNNGGTVNNPGQTGAQDGGQTGQHDQPIDYEAKFKASQAEALRLRNIAIQHGIDPKTGLPTGEPTNLGGVRTQTHLDSGIDAKAISKEIPGFEFLSATEQANVVALKQGGQRMEQLFDYVAQMIDRDKFAQQLIQLCANPAFASLRDDSAFKAFAYKSENLGTPLEVLAGSYLYQKNAGQPTPTPDNGRDDRSGLTTGSGGDRAAGQDQGKLKVDEIAHIRRTDPQRYMRMIQSGEIRQALGK